jgi:triosephosphate isomerase
MKQLIAGNWKMNKRPSEVAEWIAQLKGKLGTPTVTPEVVICAPFTHLAALQQACADSPIQWGAQDVSPFEDGAYTGDISAEMLRDLGCSYVIVGHSERRAYHHENDALINHKVTQALRYGLRPIVCVGESETQRDAGEAEAVVLKQLRAALQGVRFDDAAALVIAYEPIWAIGTGKTATADDAQAMSATIRSALSNLYPEHAQHLRILYGGSMKPDNAAQLLNKPDINGGLIGGASLKVDDFVTLIQAARDV